MGIDRRIVVGWAIFLLAAWLVLTFGFHVAHAERWLLMLVIAIGLNGYIASRLNDDGG